MKKLFAHRFGILSLVLLFSLGLFSVTRFALLLSASTQTDFNALSLLNIFGVGLIYDLAVVAYLAVPLMVYLTLLPTAFFKKKAHFVIANILLFAIYFSLFFIATAEWFFWDEFGTRFNFISVDYLIYRREVAGNIYESYPIYPILAGIGVLSAFCVFTSQKPLMAWKNAEQRFSRRLKTALVLLLFPLSANIFLTADLKNTSNNAYQNELAGNGIYQFVHAFFNNQLDYNHFYLQKDNHYLSNILKSTLTTPGVVFKNKNIFETTRAIQTPGSEKPLNVMLIVVESLSADYMGAFGNTENLTPHLDTLSKQGLFFTSFYATGTRTVRGLEALTLSIPPTPGQSIVKRPKNENLFSLGSIFSSKGYDTKFIYGGFGYFDNMNYFFKNNGFNIVDRSSMTQKEITFANIWGVADEVLFTKAIKEADQSFAAKKPFFSLIMTTSNHRPFTYPEGRIDIPSGTGKIGGVKYTDYAIGAFLKAAQKAPWFKDTLFVIVADHCASSAGKTAIPIEKYHIPLIIYAPSHIKPKTITTLSSQIDVAPTLLALLGFDYVSRFFGKNILDMPENEGRALLSTYQKLGFLKNNRLVVLSPQKKVEIFSLRGNNSNIEPHQDPLLDEALSYYQGAYYLYENNLYLFAL